MKAMKQIKINKEEIRGALARAYTADRNSHKVLDSDLLVDMTEELARLFNQSIEKAVEEREKEYINKLADMGYTMEVLEDYIIDKQWLQVKQHFYHIRGQMNEILKMILSNKVAKPKQK